jgi:hypothetical protein
MVRENMRSLDTVRFALLHQRMYEEISIRGVVHKCNGSVLTLIIVCVFDFGFRSVCLFDDRVYGYGGITLYGFL